MLIDFRLKVRDFFRRNKNKVYIILIIWAVIIALNYFLKSIKPIEMPKTTYEPHTSVMDTDSEVPKKLQTPIEQTIDKYINYCNQKDYENAYNMLSEGCKKEMFPDINDFKSYIDGIFNTKKIYNIQNYSNKDDTYIYTVRILDDVLATGLTGEQDLMYFEEKVVFQEIDGELTFAIREYIQKQPVENVYEDDNLKISVKNVITKYETEIYELEISNKTQYTIVLADYIETNEILLDIGAENRSQVRNDTDKIILPAGARGIYNVEFVRFFDEEVESNSIIFNKVRIFDIYLGKPETLEQDLENAIDLYSFEILL